MKVAFLVPQSEAWNGKAAVATYGGRVLIATTPEEAEAVPRSWMPIDLDGIGVITVTEWLETQRG